MRILTIWVYLRVTAHKKFKDGSDKLTSIRFRDNLWLVFSESGSLRDEFNQNFLEHAGIITGDQAEILELARLSQAQLNHIRAREIR